MNAQSSLQKGIYEALASDAALSGLLGGAHVYDSVPRQAAFPYVTFGRMVSRDWSTGSGAGREHFFTLHVWSRNRGYKQAQTIIGAVNDVLHDASLGLADHILVNLRFELSEMRRARDGETIHAVMRFRAVTEPMN